MDKPAILGGDPAFENFLPIIRPPLYRYATKEFLGTIEGILKSGMVTNAAYVARLEEAINNFLGVKNTVAMSSCTSGLILAQKLLGMSNKEVLVPSFTFAATPISTNWNNIKIKFTDCDRDTFNISVDDIQEKVTRDTAGIIGVHIYGNPCDIKGISEIAEDHKLKVIYDSAHGFGASYDGKMVGNFGDVEIFSCSPTKLFITMEGGILTTPDPALAKDLKDGRNYGNLPDYQVDFAGLNARMNEVSAALGMEMLRDIDEIVKNRNSYALSYEKALKKIPGVSFQKTQEKSVHAFKDFGILIHPEKFGMNRDKLEQALAKENINTKKYFYPPTHKLRLYKEYNSLDLPNTNYVSENVLCLPIYSFMEEAQITGVAGAIKNIQEHAGEIG